MHQLPTALIFCSVPSPAASAACTEQARSAGQPISAPDVPPHCCPSLTITVCAVYRLPLVVVLVAVLGICWTRESDLLQLGTPATYISLLQLHHVIEQGLRQAIAKKVLTILICALDGAYVGQGTAWSGNCKCIVWPVPPPWHLCRYILRARDSGELRCTLTAIFTYNVQLHLECGHCTECT